jgi:hypothetical protein
MKQIIYIYTILINAYKYALMRELRGPFEKFVDWWQCSAVMQREAVTIMPSYSGGGNVAVV